MERRYEENTKRAISSSMFTVNISRQEGEFIQWNNTGRSSDGWSHGSGSIQFLAFVSLSVIRRLHIGRVVSSRGKTLEDVAFSSFAQPILYETLVCIIAFYTPSGVQISGRKVSLNTEHLYSRDKFSIFPFCDIGFIVTKKEKGRKFYCI